ncbi:hypothetical protein SUGI_1198740 [Cryptomeria japonica]|nr:hypothetical protein SUGI_1198740 [Cryptomeria japonica]
MCATSLGGSLAVGVNCVADCAGHKAEPIILAAAARYDYGLLIFILTFSFIAVSGYRVDNLFVEAYERLATIVICPIWAGEDLHKLIIHNMEGLAESCEGCVAEYFRDGGDSHKDKVSKGYKCVLNSASM